MDHGPYEMAQRLLTAIEADLPLPSDVRHWLESGLRTYLHGPDHRRLCACLALSGRGRRRPGTVRAIAERNRHLRDALGAIAIDPEVSTWARCTRLADELRRFDTAWRRTRDHPEPPNHWPTWKAACWRAFATGIEVPRSARALYRIATDCK